MRSHHTFCTLPRGCIHLQGRKISPQDSASDVKTDYDYIIPIVDPSSLDLRCGRNASTAWSHPKTAVIRAGESVGFAVNTTVGLPIPNAPVMPWDVSGCTIASLETHHPDVPHSVGQTCTTPVQQQRGSPPPQAPWTSTPAMGNGSRF